MYNKQKEEDTKKPLIVYADVINEEDYEEIFVVMNCTSYQQIWPASIM